MESGSKSPPEAPPPFDSAKALVAALVQDSGGLITFVDHEERVRFATQRFAEWMGIPLPEILGRTVAEVGIPHYPRTAGSATGAKPSVILRAVRDFWRLRFAAWLNKPRAFRRGGAILGE